MSNHCEHGVNFYKKRCYICRPKERTEGRTIPPYLADDASYLRCSKCGRKSWGGTSVNSVCAMPQPDESICDGTMRGLEP